MDEFTLQIRMGNDAMQTARDASDALIEVSEDILNGRTEGRIRDLNGNTVGEWEFK